MTQSAAPVGARAVPTFVDRNAQRRVMGATDWWFYPLVAAIAAALVVISFGIDVFDQRVRAQNARVDGAALIYGPHEIARGARVDGAHVRYVVRDLGVSARAVRFAVRPGTPAPTERDTGVQLLLNPAQTAALAGKRVRVELQVHRFSVTAAGGVAVRLDNGPWVATSLPPTSGPVNIDLPAPGTAPRTLGLRMLSDRNDLNYGAELSRIVLSPAP